MRLGLNKIEDLNVMPPDTRLYCFFVAGFSIKQNELSKFLCKIVTLDICRGKGLNAFILMCHLVGCKLCFKRIKVCSAFNCQGNTVCSLVCNSIIHYRLTLAIYCSQQYMTAFYRIR